MKKIIVTIFVVLVLLAFRVFIVEKTNTPPQNQGAGTITINVGGYDYKYDFIESDTFLELLTKHHETVIVGGILYNLDHMKTNFTTTYIAIYINGEYATVGVENITLCDKCSYSFVIEKIFWDKAWQKMERVL